MHSGNVPVISDSEKSTNLSEFSGNATEGGIGIGVEQNDAENLVR